MASIFTFNNIVDALQEIDLSDEQRNQLAQIALGPLSLSIPPQKESGGNVFSERLTDSLRFVQYVCNESGIEFSGLSFEYLMDLILNLASLYR